MFLKNVPPVVAKHTQCRSFSPSKTRSQHLCFSDSDSDMQASGTSLPEKVNRIIESLRCSPSSMDKSNRCSGTTDLTATAFHTPRARHEAGPEPIADGQHSDSDDSVDREIEEAIQEFLKNKCGANQNPSQNCGKEVCKMHQPKGQNKKPKDSQILIQDSFSSGDDGIEEEIQKFLLEKVNEKHTVTQMSYTPLKLKQESELSSDHGTEEPILPSKLGKLGPNGKNIMKNSKLSVSENQYIQDNKTVKVKTNLTTATETGMVTKKKIPTTKKQKGLKPALPITVATCPTASTLSTSSRNRNGISSMADMPSEGLFNANTLNELKCENTALDFSTAIIPTPIGYDLTFMSSSLHLPPAFVNSSGSDNCSVDSDGKGKQKIANFTAMPTQIQKQLSEKTNLSRKVPGNTEQDQKKKIVLPQTKKTRLSISWKRRMKEEGQRKQPSQIKHVEDSNAFLSSMSERTADKDEDLDLNVTDKTNEPVQKVEQEKEDTQSKDQAVLHQAKLGVSLQEEGAYREKRDFLDTTEDLDKNTKKILKKRTKDTKHKPRNTVSFGDVQFHNLDRSELETTTVQECKTGNDVITTNNCVSNRKKVTAKEKEASNNHLKARMNKSTSQHLLTTENRVQTSATKPSSTKNQVEDDKSLDSSDSCRQVFVGKQSMAAQLRSNNNNPIKISSTIITNTEVPMEFKEEPQQVEVRAGVPGSQLNLSFSEVSEHQGHVDEKVLQSMPTGQHHRFFTNKEPCLKAATSIDSIINHTLNDTEYTKCITISEKRSLVTNRKKKSNRPAKHISTSHFQTKTSLVPKEDLAKSQSQTFLHENSFGFNNVRKSGMTNDGDLPQFHITKCIKNKNGSLDKLINASYYSQESLINSPPLSSLTPSRQLGGHFPHCQIILDSQRQLSDPHPPKKVKCVEENKSPHGSSRGLSIKDKALNSAGHSRDSKEKVEVTNLKEEDQIIIQDTEYIDETDYESDEQTTASQCSGKLKAWHGGSLKTSIDPGVKLRPYIAVDTPQRYQKYVKFRKLEFAAAPQLRAAPHPEQKSLNGNYEMRATSSVDVKTFYTKTTPTSRPSVTEGYVQMKRQRIKGKLQFQTT